MTAQMPINVFLKASETGDSDDQKKKRKGRIRRRSKAEKANIR